MRRVSAVLLPGLLVALLLLPDLVWLAVARPRVWVAALVLPVALLAVLFGLSGRRPWLACLLLAPFALLAPLETYYIVQYHHPTSAQIIATIVASNALETREYFGWTLLPLGLAMLAGFALALFAAGRIARARLRWGPRACACLAGAGMLAALAPLAVGYATQAAPVPPDDAASVAATPAVRYADALRDGFPFGVLPRVVEYRREWNRMRAQAARYRRFRFHARRIGPPLGRRQVYVLVIGESSRRADWQLFGYPRATNPRLSRLRNLVPLPHIITSWPESIAAIPLILTRREPDGEWDKPWPEASILRAMHEVGYETYWISNQQAIGEFDSPVSMYAYEADHVEWLNHASWSAPGSYDGDLVEPLEHALAASNRDLFIVLHMMGSHVQYDYRYPPAFAHWQPTQVSASDQGTRVERARNSYDNSIRYTDHVLAQVIGVLRASGAVTALWFESDHGELLPTPNCDREGHGVGTVPEYQIPVLFWYSDAYARTFPARVAALRGNAGQRALSADTFASLIDMAGVTFPSHRERRSLFSPAWRYRPRWVYQHGRVDFDHARIEPPCLRLEPRADGGPS